MTSRGLNKQEYVGYFADSLLWFQTATRSGGKSVVTSIEMTTSQSPISWYLDGFITPSTTGTYTFQTISDDGSYVYIQGGVVVNNGGGHGLVTVTGTYSLTAGKRYHIRVLWGNGGGPGGMYFKWSGGSQTDLTSNLTLDALVFTPRTLQSSGQISLRDIAQTYNTGTDKPLSLKDLSNVSMQYTTCTINGFYGKSDNDFAANKPLFIFVDGVGGFWTHLNNYSVATFKIVAGLSPTTNGIILEGGSNGSGGNGGYVVYAWNGILYAQCGNGNVAGGSVEVSWTIPSDWTTDQRRTIVYGATTLEGGFNSLFVDGRLRASATNATYTGDLSNTDAGGTGQVYGSNVPVNRMSNQSLAYQVPSAILSAEVYINTLPYMPSSGGNKILYAGNNFYHYFVNNDTFSFYEIPSITTPQVSWYGVGGGGAGGNENYYQGGGGGGGGVAIDTSTFPAHGGYSVVIGGGGAATSDQNANGGNGGNTTVSGSGITTLTFYGGGGGGSRKKNANSGGCGGGATRYYSAGSGSQGGNGGSANYLSGGGGGGAGQTGGNASTNRQGGIGGAGFLVSWGPYGPSSHRVGGGGGGSGDNQTLNGGGRGGSGGGGSGTGRSGTVYNGGAVGATAGSNQYGGGGGGGKPGGPTGVTLAANGGSGAFLLRYPWTFAT